MTLADGAAKAVQEPRLSRQERQQPGRQPAAAAQGVRPGAAAAGATWACSRLGAWQCSDSLRCRTTTWTPRTRSTTCAAPTRSTSASRWGPSARWSPGPSQSCRSRAVLPSRSCACRCGPGQAGAGKSLPQQPAPARRGRHAAQGGGQAGKPAEVAVLAGDGSPSAGAGGWPDLSSACRPWSSGTECACSRSGPTCCPRGARVSRRLLDARGLPKHQQEVYWSTPALSSGSVPLRPCVAMSVTLPGHCLWAHP